MKEDKLTEKESEIVFMWVLSLMSICIFDIDTVIFWVSFTIFVGTSLYGIRTEEKNKSLNKEGGNSNDR